MPYMEMSAKTGLNVMKAFHLLARAAESVCFTFGVIPCIPCLEAYGVLSLLLLFSQWGDVGRCQRRARGAQRQCKRCRKLTAVSIGCKHGNVQQLSRR